MFGVRVYMEALELMRRLQIVLLKIGSHPIKLVKSE